MSGLADPQAFDILDGTDQVHGRFANRSLDFVVAGVADQNQRVSLPGEPNGLQVDLGDQGTGGVDYLKLLACGQLPDSRGHAVGAEDADRMVRDFLQVVHEDDPTAAQTLHHVLVVDDLVEDVDGRREKVQRAFDHFDGADHSGTEPPGIGQNDFPDWHGCFSLRCDRLRGRQQTTGPM